MLKLHGCAIGSSANSEIALDKHIKKILSTSPKSLEVILNP